MGDAERTLRKLMKRAWRKHAAWTLQRVDGQTFIGTVAGEDAV